MNQYNTGKIMRRGDVYWANLSQVYGSEQGGIRPAVIIQNDIGNQFSRTVIVAPVTSQKKPNLPTHVLAGDKMNLGSIILLEQIKTIDKDRIREFMCHLSDDIMLQVNKAIKISLGLNDKKEGDDGMNDSQVFNNEEMQLKVRTILNEDGSISVNADDTAIGFGWCRTEMKNGKEYRSVMWARMNGYCKEIGFAHSCAKDDYIPESLFYRLGMKANNPAADKFQNWIAMDVIPSIRKTGGYGRPMTVPEQIKLLAQGNVELEKKIETVNNRMDALEQNMPLYGCEIDEVKNHINRKGVKILGGKDSEAYRNNSIRGSVYSDMYRQLKREYGAVSSYKNIKRKYLADLHDFIDCYEPPRVLAEQIEGVNSQMTFGRTV